MLKRTHSLVLTDAVSIDKAMASCDVVEGGDYDTAIMVTHVKMTEKDPIWCWGRSVLQKKTDDDGSTVKPLTEASNLIVKLTPST